MTRILNKIQTSLYRAVVVANTRYRDDVLNLQAMSLTYSTLLSLVPPLTFFCNVMRLWTRF
jgi:uncharacterized BrkB/YihY/UPF0761 family membrane protein